MKKILSLVLALVFSIILTDCGNTGSARQAETSAVPASVTPKTEESENTDDW